MNKLPEDCIAKILSLTSPLDVCRSSAVSTTFRSAADSDDVWNHFLPSEFPDGFTPPEGLSTRKDLFFSLVNNPLRLHHSPLIFWLERKSGNKCYMMAPRALDIAWGNDQRYWQWISLPNTRFAQVAELNLVWWLHITGKFNITYLSDDTLYVSYLVFKWNDDPYGFRHPVEASLVLSGTNRDDLQPSMVTLMLDRGTNQNQSTVQLRTDGWFEVELGRFFKTRGDLGHIEMSLKETTSRSEKKGLIVHGIEIRPLS